MQAVHTLVGHTNYVWTASFSLDGSRVVTCSSDETARVWNLAGGCSTEATLRGHSGVVRACQFSPDSRLIATCSWDKTIRVFLTHDHLQPAYVLYGHKFGVTDCQFSPSGNLLASSSWDDTVALWDVATGQLLRQLSGHTSAVSSCSFGVGGSWLASGSWDGTVRVWDLAQSSPAAMCCLSSGQGEAVYDVACSPVEQGVLASCGRKGVVAVWDVRNQAVVQALQSSSRETNCVSFSPSGQQLATGNDLCEILLWDLQQVKVSSFQAIAPVTLLGHSGVVYGVTYSTDGSYMASCSADNTCKIWSVMGSAVVTNLADSLASMLNIASNT